MQSQIIANIQSQTNKFLTSSLTNFNYQIIKRLIAQLKELEEYKNELEPEEYDSMKNETLDQLKTFQQGLKEMTTGEKTLLDEIAKSQLEIQNAVKNAFNIDLIAQTINSSGSQGIREKLKGLERDFQLGRIKEDHYIQESLKLLADLMEMKCDLTPEESQFLKDHATGQKKFAQSNDDKQKGSEYLKDAEQQLHENKLN